MSIRRRPHSPAFIHSPMATISTCLTITPKPTLLTFTSSSTFHKPLTKPFLSFPLNRRTTINKNRLNLVVRPPRATVDFGGGIRPGGVVETDKLPTDVRKLTMDAVDGCGGRVTIGDVASRAGLKVNEAQKALQALAADTNGFLEVSEEGEILYVFPKDYQSKLDAKSFRMKVEPLIEKAKNAGEYVIRVSFGTTLIVSIVIVCTAIIAILIGSSSEEERRRSRGSKSYDSDSGSGFKFSFSRRDTFWYWDPNYYRRRRVQADDNKTNFIESVFSFVFGDGDPNQGIEEERWKLIGQYISSNGGVVAAEELAPYLDIDSTERIKDGESYMLPVLLRFDGQPVVDEEGNILYRFPSLQTTASQKSKKNEYVVIDKILEEKKWQFRKTSLLKRAMVIGLGGFNLFAVFILGALLASKVSVRPGGFIKFVAVIFPLLQIYAASFFVVPLVRWFLIRKWNSDIEKRNMARQQCAQVLELPDISLMQKLFSARDMAQKTVIGQDQIVYSTDKGFLVQRL